MSETCLCDAGQVSKKELKLKVRELVTRPVVLYIRRVERKR